MKTPTTLALALLLLGVLIAALGSPSAADILLRISALVILATSWNLMANAGLISLGHSAFWGLGSYVTMSVANHFELNFALSLIPAFITGGLVGGALAAVTGRLRGVFFAITTLALSEGLRIAALMLPDLTGGAVGVYIMETVSPHARGLQILCLSLAVVVVVFAAWLTTTRFHFASRALRNSEQASQMLGIDPRRYRISVIAISGAIASLAGGLNAGYSGYIDPDIAFSLNFTLLPQIAVIMGGLFTVAGPVIGAVIVVSLGEVTRLAFGARAGASLLVYGILLVLSVQFMKNGILGYGERLMHQLRCRSARTSAERAR
jgi:branched-chain amino acid transport system permease protein